MARTRKASEVKTEAYRHTGDKRKNIPSAKIAAEGKIPKVKKARYYYSPHLSPELRFDPTREADRILHVAEAARGYATEPFKAKLEAALQKHQPWLEWAGKKEEYDRGFFDVDPVALHIHERVSAQAIVRTAMRQDAQRNLFADPQLPYQKEIQFYQHDVDWANRLILGDSLQVMSSLTRRENLAEKVQMVYMDPPYGIRFASNFQPEVRKRDVKDKSEDMTREAEMVKAYRDTWTLGVHSYLSYLRDRFIVCRDLLSNTGSLFLQISDENIHLVRCLLDDIFGTSNHCATISFRRGGFQTSELLPSTFDHILWYAKDKSHCKYYRVYEQKEIEDAFMGQQIFMDKNTGERIRVNRPDIHKCVNEEANIYRHKAAYSATGSESSRFPVIFEGHTYTPPTHRGWSTNSEGMERLIKSNRVLSMGNSLEFNRPEGQNSTGLPVDE